MEDGDERTNDSGYISDECPLRTHPDKYDHTHIDSLEVFKQDLQQALKGSFPQKACPYEAVHVLLLRWAEDDLQVQSEIDQLRHVFRDQFRFETEEWQIPSLGSTRALQHKLYTFQNAHQKESELLILYYGGHGEADFRRGRSIWRANKQPKSPYLNWSSLQHLLENAVPNVLIILDCCFAANAARDTAEGTTKELLAACGRENPTLGVGSRSFTSALIDQLRAFGSTPFTVTMLHCQLITMRGLLAYTPVCALLSEHSGCSITLAPLELSTPVSFLINSPATTETVRSDEMDIAADVEIGSGSQSSPGGTRVLLAISVVQDANHDVIQWKSWLTSQAPPDVANVEVELEGVFDSHSMLVLVSIPITVWDRLSDRAAYLFIGFIRSKNRLQDDTKCQKEVTSVKPKISEQPSDISSLPPDGSAIQTGSKFQPQGKIPLEMHSRKRYREDLSDILLPQSEEEQVHTVSSIKSHFICKSRKYDPVNLYPATASEIVPQLNNSQFKGNHGWSTTDDDQLLQARDKGLQWLEIAPKYFPSRSPNACRKRHEGLKELQVLANYWDGRWFENPQFTGRNAQEQEKIKSFHDDGFNDSGISEIEAESAILSRTASNLSFAKEYLETRERMWKMLADLIDEEWTTVEATCFEQGLEVLQLISRHAQE